MTVLWEHRDLDADDAAIRDVLATVADLMADGRDWFAHLSAMPLDDDLYGLCCDVAHTTDGTPEGLRAW